MITPPYLKQKDTIAITCPAGYMPAEKAATCITTLRQKGYTVIVGKTLGSKSQNYFSGTDAQRLKELQSFLDDKNISAILFGRGGYGMGRIIDKIDFTTFIKHPKWLIGFSDITILHSHIFSNFKIATLHAPMAAAFNDGGFKDKYTGSLFAALAGDKGMYTAAANKQNKVGVATGKLVGGNLSLLANAVGTASDIKTNNHILFIEDIGEQLYVADRMLYQLKRSGKLNTIAGLVVGGFTDMKDTERPFGKNIFQLIKDIVKEYDYPICFNFPISHNRENVAVKIGCRYQLSVNKNEVSLKEL